MKASITITPADAAYLEALVDFITAGTAQDADFADFKAGFDDDDGEAQKFVSIKAFAKLRNLHVEDFLRLVPAPSGTSPEQLINLLCALG